jgi:alanine racemase
MITSSTIRLSKSALEKNLNYLKAFIGSDVKISSVVKGNAYGHGIEYFVKLARSCGINHFSVYSSEEAIRVMTTSDSDTEILIMGWLAENDVLWAVENNLQFFVFEENRLIAAIQAARMLGKPAVIHLELETGMNRTGFTKHQLQKIISIILENNRHLQLEGVCTHYAGAESIANYYRIQNQYKEFKRLQKWLAGKGIVPRLYHSASSAAALAYPKMRMDMVRIGILLYGFWPSQEIFINHLATKKIFEDPLERVLSWRSVVMSTKRIKMGQFIGYGTNFLAQRETDIAVIPIGYSYGYSRSLSNSGRVLVKGQRANVLGTVNMNLIIIDITDIPDVQIGDEVVMIGNQGDETITVHSFSEMTEQLNYEVLTRLPSKIPRQIID